MDLFLQAPLFVYNGIFYSGNKMPTNSKWKKPPNLEAKSGKTHSTHLSLYKFLVL